MYVGIPIDIWINAGTFRSSSEIYKYLPSLLLKKSAAACFTILMLAWMSNNQVYYPSSVHNLLSVTIYTLIRSKLDIVLRVTYYTLLYIAIYTHSSYVLYILYIAIYTHSSYVLYILYIAIYTHSSYVLYILYIYSYLHSQ